MSISNWLKTAAIETGKDFFSKSDVSRAQLNTAVEKLKLQGEFDKADDLKRRYSEGEFGRTGITDFKRRTIFNKSNITTTLVRVGVIGALAPLALPAIFARNAFNEWLYDEGEKVATKNQTQQPDTATSPAIAIGSTPTEGFTPTPVAPLPPGGPIR